MTRVWVVHLPAAEARHLAGLPSWPSVPAGASLLQRPVRGPFGPRGGLMPLTGQVTYLGGGAVRLDDAALRSLSGLADGEDFRVTWTDTGPILEVGADRYIAREESPDSQSGTP